MIRSIEQLREAGQSIWLDYIRRGLITSGELRRMVDDGLITGVTSNPTIFEKAIAGSTDYDTALREMAVGGVSDPYEAFVTLAAVDIRGTADVLRDVYDATQAKDGYVSLELPPGMENNAEKSVEEARRLWGLVDRPNLMIKVPGTTAGIPTLERLIAEGINVNVTLLFDVAIYEQVAAAYLAGLEKRVAGGNEIRNVAGVASFFVSRTDAMVDPLLPKGSPLAGRVAVANALAAYQRFETLFAGPRWEKLAAEGARPQRLLWASTSTKNNAYSDVLYVESLIAPDTVNTVPEATLRAFADHGRVAGTIQSRIEDHEDVLQELEATGVDLASVNRNLLEKGLASFGTDFERLLERVGEALDAGRPIRVDHEAGLGGLGPSVAAALDRFRGSRGVRRLWDGDHTLWKPDPTEISDRLGWLTVVDAIVEEAGELESFAAEVAGDGFRTAVLLGMGGSSLAAEVFNATFGTAPGMLDLVILDTTDPSTIKQTRDRLDLEHTLFIVASKSGSTLETLSQFRYFWGEVPNGANFIAITDPGSGLEALGEERGFRRVFLNQPDIGGRYSALSHFGLVPAALIGADLEGVLDRAQQMLAATHPCVPIEENPGAWLGAVLGVAAQAGRDKLTLVLPPPIASFGYWVEQLIAESTGKEGVGIVPVEGETVGAPEYYGDDRLFVAIGDHPELAALEAAGHPVVRFPYRDQLQLGSEFVRWEFATAVAGHILGIQPFDQPNVQAAKDATGKILAGEKVDPETPSVAEVLAQVGPGDYVAIQSYLSRSDDVEKRLRKARARLRDRYKVATTVGYGPRFLHSTGQLHKGGANNGVFLQVIDADSIDLAIPGQSYSFGELKTAQALGDLNSLRNSKRRVARVTLDQLEKVIS